MAGDTPRHARRLRRLRLLAGIALIPALAGCEAASSSQATSAPASNPAHIDSIFPPDEQMRRFREGLPVVEGLSEGSGDLPALAGRFAAAVASADTADLRRMVLSRAEFAHLYFPASPFSRPPMRQDPALTWFLIQQNSEKGIARVLRRFGAGGEAFDYRGVRCEAAAEVQGENRIWSGCTLLVRWPDGSEGGVRWFGSVLERDGRFKLISFANDL